MRMHSTVRSVAALVAVVLAALGIAACGSGDDGDDGSTTAGKTYRIGVVIPSMASDFHARMKSGMEAAARRLPEVKLEYFYGSQISPNAADQIQGINTAMAKQVDALVVADAFPSTRPALEKALAEDVPVVFTDYDGTGLSPSRASLAATDNRAAGQLAAEYLARVLGRGGKLGLLDGLPTFQANYDRTNESARLLPDQGIDVVGRGATSCTLDGGVTVTQNLVTAHPDVELLYSACGPPTVGAATVLKRLGLTDKVKLVGFDASRPEVRAIKAETQLASVSQLPEQEGYYGVQMALRVLETGQVQPSVTTPTVIVTKDNADTFLDGAIPKG